VRRRLDCSALAERSIVRALDLLFVHKKLEGSVEEF
jgi:hypothetical protein